MLSEFILSIFIHLVMAHICDECARRSHITITSSESDEHYSPKTPEHPPGFHQNSRTPGTTPNSKRCKKALFCSPGTREKIDEIHHYQKHQVDLQREMYYEQKLTASRLTYLEQIASFFCSSNKHNVHEPTHMPSSSRTPNLWDIGITTKMKEQAENLLGNQENNFYISYLRRSFILFYLLYLCFIPHNLLYFIIKF